MISLFSSVRISAASPSKLLLIITGFLIFCGYFLVQLDIAHFRKQLRARRNYRRYYLYVDKASLCLIRLELRAILLQPGVQSGFVNIAHFAKFLRLVAAGFILLKDSQDLLLAADDPLAGIAF
jgi:uncharacterized membrane protein